MCLLQGQVCLVFIEQIQSHKHFEFHHYKRTSVCVCESERNVSVKRMTMHAFAGVMWTFSALGVDLYHHFRMQKKALEDIAHLYDASPKGNNKTHALIHKMLINSLAFTQENTECCYTWSSGISGRTSYLWNGNLTWKLF